MSLITTPETRLSEISTPEYWEDQASMPKISPRAAIVDGFSSVHIFASYGASEIMDLCRIYKSINGITEHISDGNEMPLLRRGEGLLKAVIDVRKLNYEPSKVKKILKMAYQLDDEDEFNHKSEKILGTSVYLGESAVASMQSQDESGAEDRIWRSALYFTGSVSGSQLEGINSIMLTKSTDQSRMNFVTPPLKVGQTYIFKKNGGWLMKIAAAELLIPGSPIKEKVKKPKRLMVAPRLAIN